MKNVRLLATIAGSSLGLLCVLLAIAIVYPTLEKALAVEAVQPGMAIPTESPERITEPEELLVTAIYRREEDTREIAAIYIEVFHTGTGKAFYMEVPVHTKVRLSTELFKKLQAYSPELPQDFKLSKMGEGFSEEYGLTACNRILSEILGVTIEHYICANAEELDAWSEGIRKQVTAETPQDEFYLRYGEWLEQTEADMTTMERWVYYESYRNICPAEKETAPGAEGVSEYIISGKLAQSRLQEFMRLTEE